MKNPNTAVIVRHPAGGWTMAVPVGNGSTVRIYRGHWSRRPKKISQDGRIAA